MMNVFELVASLTLDTSEYEKGLNQSEEQGSKFGKGLKTAGKVVGGALVAASAATVKFGKDSVAAGMAFDSSMSQVAATMGLTTDEIGELSEFAQKMGSETVFSATQSADALNYMALAGYDAETSMAMLPNVLNLAAAGGIELASASDMVTDAQSALGLSLDETAVMVDQMAKASSKSNTSVAQLGEAFLVVGGTAKNIQGGTTELATALGILADNGIKGAEGGTTLRNMILSLTAPTDTAAKKMEELGLTAFDAEGNMRPLNDVFGDLNGILSSMTGQEQTEVLNTIFNKVDLKGANALLSATNETLDGQMNRWETLSGDIDDAQGAAEKMANTQLDNLAGDITLFKSALEGAQIAVSNGLSPTLRNFVQLASSGLSDITNGFKEGGLTGAMQAFGTFLSNLITQVVDMLPSIIEAGAALLGALITGIVENLPKLVDTALVLIETIANGLGEYLPVIIPAVVDVILLIVEKLTEPDTMSMLINAAFLIIGGVATGIIKAIPNIVKTIPQVVKNLVKAITENFPQIVTTLFRLLGDLFAAIVEMIAEAMGTDLQAVGDGLRAIGETITTAFNNIKSWFSDLGTNLATSVSNMWANIKQFFTDGLNGARTIVETILTSIKDKFSSILEGAKEVVKNAIETIKGFFNFDWKLPDLKLPHFKIKGEFSLDPPSVPSIGVDWYKKAYNDAYLLNDATIFGAAGGKLLGGGEGNGSEAIVGTGFLKNMMRDVLREQGYGSAPNVIQVYIGEDKIDEFVVNSTQRANFLSGGR